MKILNLYSGIGGNRKLWGDHDVTAVEIDKETADIYQDNFPKDTVIVTDAHDYLINNLDNDWDFIWSSPPCQTHTRMENINHKRWGARYPDMSLYQEIIILDKHSKTYDFDYTVENVVSYYQPLYTPQKRGRHYLWSNFEIDPYEKDDSIGIHNGWKGKDYHKFDAEKHENKMMFDMSKYDITKTKRDQVLKNCLDPRLGKHILNCSKNHD